MNMPAPTATTCPPQAPPLSQRWKVLIAGFVANAALIAATAGLPTTALSLSSDYGFGHAELAWVFGSMGLGLALSELPWGMLTDRWGDRPVLLCGLLVTGLALLGLAIGGQPGDGALIRLCAGLTLAGLAGGSVNAASGRAVMAWFGPGERGLAMSIRQTAVPLGGLLGACVLPSLARQQGFSLVFGLLAGLCALAGYLTWRWLHEAPGQSQAEPERRALRPAWSEAPLWRLALGIGVLCMPQFVILSFGAVFIHEQLGGSLLMVSASLATLQLGAAVARVLSGRWSDRNGNRHLYLWRCVLAAAAAYLLLAGATALLTRQMLPPALVLALLIGCGILISAWHGVAYTELASQAGVARAGTVLGMANTLVFAGMFLTPTLVAAGLRHGDWPLVWGVAALLTLAAWPLLRASRG